MIWLLEFRTPRGRMRHACISSWGGILTAGCHVQAADSAGARNCAHLPRCSRCLWIDREPDS